MRLSHVLCAVLVCSGITYTSAQDVQCEIDLLILIDKSGSITDVNPTNPTGSMLPWYQATNFTLNTVTTFTSNSGTRAGMVTFGNNAQVFGSGSLVLTGNTTLLMEKVIELRDSYQKHSTNTAAALDEAIAIFSMTGSVDTLGTGNRPNVPDVIILLTDGEPTRAPGGLTLEANGTQLLAESVTSRADILKGMGVVIITVAININKEEANNLLSMTASSPNEFIEVMDFAELELRMQPIIDQTCRAVPIVKPCRQPADIYFAIDSSGSVTDREFQDIRQFVATLQHELPLGPDEQSTRTGVVTWSDSDMMVYNLEAYPDIYLAGNATLTTPYMRSVTKTHQILNYVRETAFTSGNGDRSNIPNIFVIFTDGNSNNADRAEATMAAAYALKTSGVHVISVGVGDWFNLYELQGLASDPYSSNYIHVTDTATLPDYKNQLKALLCNDVDNCNPNPCQAGTLCEGQCVDKIGDYTCYCPDSCSGKQCENNCFSRMNAVFSVDSSSSMVPNDFRHQLDFVGSVTTNLNMNSGDRVGMTTFSQHNGASETMTPLFGLTSFSNIDGLKNGITTFFRGGGTNTYDTVSLARNTMFGSGNGNPDVLIILTDGKSTDFEATWEQARLAREQGINVIVVAIGSQFSNYQNPQNFGNIMELQAMASGMDNTNVFYVDNFAALSGAVTDVSNAVCNNVGECESFACQNGGTRVDRIGYCECECPVQSPSQPVFSGIYCERPCSGLVDIVLVIDSSGSMRNDRFGQVKDFIIELIKQFPVGNNLARFGAIYFSDAATVAFNLDTYQLTEDIISHVKTMIPFLGGTTHTADALSKVPDVFANGGRFNADKFVFLITDGKSNVNEENTIPQAVLVRENIANILVLAIGTDANTLEASGVASRPTDNFLVYEPSFNDVLNNQDTRSGALSKLVDAMCDSVNECDANPCNPDGTDQCFDEYHSYFCQCNNLKSGRDCSRDCPQQLDVTLMLDLSGSMDMVLSTTIAMAREIAYGLPNDARVAVVEYSSQATLKFGLDAYVTREQVINALSFGSSGGTTQTLDAINLLTQSVYTPPPVGGDRSGNRNVAIFITDGGSNQSPDSLQAAAQAASNNINGGLERYVAAVGEYELNEVNAIASDPDSSYVVPVGMSEDVASAANTILDRICA